MAYTTVLHLATKSELIYKGCTVMQSLCWLPGTFGHAARQAGGAPNSIPKVAKTPIEQFQFVKN
eukprot:5601816-Amphidinium_carterae.3